MHNIFILYTFFVAFLSIFFSLPLTGLALKVQNITLYIPNKVFIVLQRGVVVEGVVIK